MKRDAFLLLALGVVANAASNLMFPDVVAAAKDCAKFTNEKKCTNDKNGKRCKWEGECVAKSTCEKQTKKGKLQEGR